MSKRLQDQASKLWQTISDPITTGTYRQTIVATWLIIKETGVLLWLVICFGLVATEWLWKWSYNAGGQFRVWVTNLSTIEPSESGDSSEFWSKTGQSLVDTSKKTALSAISAAREQLGLEPLPTPPPAEAAPQPPAQPAADSATASPASTDDRSSQPD